MSSTPWHLQSSSETATALQVDVACGLLPADITQRQVQRGLNTLVAAKQRSAWTILLRQFRSLMVGLLVIAGGIAFALGDVIEAFAIIVVIVVNALIGFVTEWKAAGALDGLRKQTIAAEHLVPGDVVLLASGDRIPADGRIIEHARLQVDEAALTGESLPVTKSSDSVATAEAPVGDRTSMVYLGTAVSEGRGTFLVTDTGARTELGRVHTMVEEAGERGTPLEAKLTQLSHALLVLVPILCAVIVLLGWLRGNDLLAMVEVGISLAIAAMPEGLLAVTTMTLAVGMQRMARVHALVRRLPAVESLGSTTVICTDKTGTLTRNEMTVRVFSVGAQRIDVTGTGYAAEGVFQIAGRKVEPLTELGEADPLHLALRIGALCNDAKLDRSGDVTTVLGDPIEAALVVAAEKAGRTRNLGSLTLTSAAYVASKCSSSCSLTSKTSFCRSLAVSTVFGVNWASDATYEMRAGNTYAGAASSTSRASPPTASRPTMVSGRKTVM